MQFPEHSKYKKGSKEGYHMRSLHERRCKADLKFLYKLVDFLINDLKLLGGVKF